MKSFFILVSLYAFSLPTFAKSDISLVRVYKSERRLELVNSNNQVVKTYKVMLGKNPIGHKEQEGDNKTPEGTYSLDQKNPNSNFYKSLHISYPNFKDKMKAKKRGVKPGGDIMLHGLPNDFKEMNAWLETAGLSGLGDDLIRAALPYLDWTSGCIAVTDEEIEEIYNLINVPTKILIQP